MGSPFFHPERVRTTLDSLRQVFTRVTPYFAYVPLYGSLWGFAVASDRLDPRAMMPAEVERVIAERKLEDLQYYNGDTHRAVFAIPNYVKPLVG
jgi:spermidine synthase